jgi:hypothetical protein
MTYEQWLTLMRVPFPKLNAANSRPTSPVDEGYNCIAWAAEDSERWWWPDPQEQNYWPPSAPRVEAVPAFVEAYASLGYVHTTDGSLESGKQKIAIFVDAQGKPRHAARQLKDGWWTSKLGQEIDIEHELSAIEGPEYGTVAVVVARQVDR